jgi:hypothetical protein
MSPSFAWASEEPDHPRMSGWGSSAGTGQAISGMALADQVTPSYPRYTSSSRTTSRSGSYGMMGSPETR